MSDRDVSEKLKHEQYNTVDKLAARIRLHEQFSTNKISIFHWMFNRLLAFAPPHGAILEIGCGRGGIDLIRFMDNSWLGGVAGTGQRSQLKSCLPAS